ncbi:MAG: DUF5668 domain-containing protein [Candidatus Aminicenantes bacterium]|nr:DUF5668 domain-containing protein [Candidatus Aminicenantes bacterium]
MVDKVVYTRPPKSPVLAGVLSFFFPGTGSLYNREYMKGILYILIFAGLVTLQTQGDAGQPFKGLILGGFYIFQIIDAIQVAKAINQKALTGEAPKNGEDFALAVKGGSIFWGAILIALGAIFLLANFEVIDYDTLLRFWPVLVIGFGGKVIYDYYRRDK